VNKITKLLQGSTVNIPKRPGEPDITFASIRKIFLKTGWKPKISIEQGIKNILVHIEDWKHAPVWTPSKISQKTKKWFYYLGKQNKK
jgi:UDP-glucose 4-epimerase